MKFRKLFEPTHIDKLELKNRIVMPAMSTNLANTDGSISQRQKDYYVERAKGGVGLIILEAVCVESALGKLSAIEPCIDDDKFVAGLNELAEEVQIYGSKIALQLNHSGRRSQWTGSRQPVSASGNLLSPRNVRSRALSKREIVFLVDCFSEAASRARKACFDAIEIHGTHGYLVAQFLSPYTNRRTDEYGGDVHGRSRFALEIVERTKEKVGDDLPIIFRISGEELVKGGLTLDDSRKIAQKLETAGVSAIHVSAGAYEARQWWSTPPAIDQGYLVPLAAKIKEAVEIPVIAVGRIIDPEFADKVIAEGKADLVAMGRTLIADPYLPRKAMEGRMDQLRCLSCNRCLARFADMQHIKCTVNPNVGRESESQITSTSRRRRILVAGGGPAGLEVAYIAASRGHEVILYEKDRRLGGQLNLALIPPHKQNIEGFMSFLISRVKSVDVEVKTNREVTAEIVEDLKPDVAIVATGSSPIIPNIEGVNSPNVITAKDALLEKRRIDCSAIVVGGGMVGCETAEFLVRKAESVKIVEMLAEIAIDIEPRSRTFLLERLKKEKIETFTKARVCEITTEGVIVRTDIGKKTLKAGAVVLAVGAKAEGGLAESLKGKVNDVYLIGDCLRPRKIMEAVEEGFLIGIHL